MTMTTMQRGPIIANIAETRAAVRRAVRPVRSRNDRKPSQAVMPTKKYSARKRPAGGYRVPAGRGLSGRAETIGSKLDRNLAIPRMPAKTTRPARPQSPQRCSLRAG
jgi:hypothetical protein